MMPIAGDGRAPVMAELRRRHGEALQTNRKLWLRLRPSGRLPAALCLSPTEAAAIRPLMVNDLLSMEAIIHAIYDDSDGQGAPCDRTVIVIVAKLRQKLKPFGIEIENVRSAGYRIPAASKARMHELMAAEARATGRPLSAFVRVTFGSGYFVVPSAPAASTRTASGRRSASCLTYSL